MPNKKRLLSQTTFNSKCKNNNYFFLMGLGEDSTQLPKHAIHYIPHFSRNIAPHSLLDKKKS
jgi:hypothetical protein